MLAALSVCCAARLFQATAPAARLALPDGSFAGPSFAFVPGRPLRAPAPQATAAAVVWAVPWALSTVAGFAVGSLANRERGAARSPPGASGDGGRKDGGGGGRGGGDGESEGLGGGSGGHGVEPHPHAGVTTVGKPRVVELAVGGVADAAPLPGLAKDRRAAHEHHQHGHEERFRRPSEGRDLCKLSDAQPAVEADATAQMLMTVAPEDAGMPGSSEAPRPIDFDAEAVDFAATVLRDGVQTAVADVEEIADHCDVADLAVEAAVRELDARISCGKAAVMFTSASCGPCRLADYFFRNLEGSQKYPDVAFVKVDVCSEEGKALYDKYDVQGLPTILYFNDGDAFGSPSRGGKAAYSLDDAVCTLAKHSSASRALARLAASPAVAWRVPGRGQEASLPIAFRCDRQ